MKPGLQIGHQYEYTVQVREDMQAQFVDGVVHPLYGTAAMIMHMEWAARQHILPYLEPGEEGVGCHVDVRHLKPTPVGSTVRVRSTVSAIEDKRISSRVEAWNETEKIGEGTLVQALVSLERLYAGLPKAQDTTDPDAPPPAELVSFNGTSRLSLEVLKWETGGLACTRYDEWLVCRIRVQTPEQTGFYEGAFLLRYELEEWLNAAAELSRNQRSAYRSDFLEPVLKVGLETTEPGEYLVSVDIHPIGNGNGQGSPASARMEVGRQALSAFSRQLEAQLAGFPSKL